jgi:hypothetical protein
MKTNKEYDIVFLTMIREEAKSAVRCPLENQGSRDASIHPLGFLAAP